jgi:hypothetical protein
VSRSKRGKKSEIFSFFDTFFFLIDVSPFFFLPVKQRVPFFPWQLDATTVIATGSSFFGASCDCSTLSDPKIWGRYSFANCFVKEKTLFNVQFFIIISHRRSNEGAGMWI